MLLFFFFFFNDTATTEIYTLSLHDALPIWVFRGLPGRDEHWLVHFIELVLDVPRKRDQEARRSPVVAFQSNNPKVRSEETRLNSSHVRISYAVFCLKKKKKKEEKKQKRNKT